ncbi:MAG: CrcB family protein [Muribaculaceae bacterium]|nr:CrcB family protein [Muribaculaceae bacterium]
MVRDFLLVGIGGAMGSMARYAITLLTSYFSIVSEIGTLTANALGSLLIGIIIALSKGDMYLLGAVGFCGGFTTFSTFSSQALQLIQNGQRTMGITYILCSIIVCILMTWIGILFAEKFIK